MGDDHKREDMYVYDLPYVERKKLCDILDMNNMWKELGGEYMKFGLNELEKFRRAELSENSPTDRMLEVWGRKNNTILGLFSYLWQMGHYQAMSAIKSCVPLEYHKLLDTRRRHLRVFEREGFGTRSSKGAEGDAVSNGHPAPHQSTKVEVNGSAEGATALPSSALKDNLNHTASPPRQWLVAEKVPENLLNPSAISTLPSITPKVTKPPQSRYDGKLEAIHETSKIMNNGHNRRMTEVSCEDNNSSKLQSGKSKKSDYNALDDYNRMAEEKRAKFLHSEAAAREAVNQSTHLGNMSRSKMNGTAVAASESSAHASAAPPQNNAASNARLHPQHPPHPRHPPHERERRISTASDASRHSECVVPVIPYKDLEEATACWSKANLLGRGGFGTVYKGYFRNSEVAVKKITLHGNADIDSAQLQIEQTLDELKLSQAFPHDNILQVFGYSADPDKAPCLVYQFMPNGSVEDRLQLRKVYGVEGGPPSGNWAPLSWRQRYTIALGTAKALQYLHTVKERPLIHGDVKSANILLDKNFEPKLCDFGLAREGKSQSTSMKISRVHGTKPYLPHDYLRSKKLSVKVDTYSYGIVLFELCTGLRAYDDKRKEGEKFLKELVEETKEDNSLRDQNVGSESDDGIFSFLLSNAKDCVLALATRRPKMEKVYMDLVNYRVVMQEHMARNAVPNTPYQLQWRYDMTGRSILTPVSPSSQASLPISLHPSQVPSGAMMPGPYQSLPSSTFMPPRSPVPPHPPNSPVPPHYSPSGYRFHHPPRPHCVPWQQGGGDPFQYGVPNHILEVRPVHKINVSPVVANGIIAGDRPSSYIEAITPTGGGPVIGNNSPINPLIPQLSDLNVNSGSQHPTSNATSSGYNESSGSESSGTSSTAHNVGNVNLHNGQAASQGAAALGGARYIPTVISNSPRNDSCAYLPLLSALGQPTAAAGHKKSIFDD